MTHVTHVMVLRHSGHAGSLKRYSIVINRGAESNQYERNVIHSAMTKILNGWKNTNTKTVFAYGTMATHYYETDKALTKAQEAR